MLPARILYPDLPTFYQHKVRVHVMFFGCLEPDFSKIDRTAGFTPFYGVRCILVSQFLIAFIGISDNLFISFFLLCYRTSKPYTKSK